MGTTHHWNWTEAPDAERFAQGVRLALDCAIVAKHEGIPTAGWDGTDLPLFASGEIAFNGVDDDAYESFNFLPGESGFCKTSGIVSGPRKYAQVVVATLACFWHLFPDTFCPHTEADYKEIVQGVTLAERNIPGFDRVGFVNQLCA